jgi:hypothetical protein
VLNAAFLRAQEERVKSIKLKAFPSDKVSLEAKMNFNEKREHIRHDLAAFENYLKAEITDADGETKAERVKLVDISENGCRFEMLPVETQLSFKVGEVIRVNMYFAKTYYVPLEFEVLNLSDPEEETVSVGGVFSISKSPENFSDSQHEQFKAWTMFIDFIKHTSGVVETPDPDGQASALKLVA